MTVRMTQSGEEKLAKALQLQTGLEDWDPKRAPVHPKVIASFPRELAVEHRVFPVAVRRNSVGVTWCLATVVPREDVAREIGTALCTPEEPVIVAWLLSTASAIDAAIEEHYTRAPYDTEEIQIMFEDPVEQERATIARIQIARKSSSPGSEETG